MHPERLQAVSIAAPGIVTVLDEQADWLAGVRNFEAVFGKPLDLDAMRRAAVHMVAGGDDIATWEIALSSAHRWWQPEFDAHGATRIERMETLKASYLAQGIGVVHDVVPGADHRQAPLLPAVKSFLSARLAQVRAQDRC